MKISADFDSGNIQVIDASDPQRVLLAMRPTSTAIISSGFTFWPMACSRGNATASA